MHVWEYDPATLQKGADGVRWMLERSVLYGLAGRKLDVNVLKKYLPDLHIPPEHRRFLTLILE